MTSPATPPPQPDPRLRLASVTAPATDGGPAATSGMNSVKACEAAGITYRQLDYWARCGYLHALNEQHLGTGSCRLFSEVEVDVARHTQLLLEAGFLLRDALRLGRAIVETGEPITLAGGLVTINPPVSA